MKNIFIIVLVSIGILFCSHKNNDNLKIVAVCLKIIIQDTTKIHTTNFLVSYYNPTNRDIIIFANSYDRKISDTIYKEAGAFLKINNFETAIGQFYSTNKFKIYAGKTLKVLYTYSDKYPNAKIDYTKGSNSMEHGKMELYYKYNKAIIDPILGKGEINNTINFDFPIDMSKVVVEYKKDLNIEEAIRLVEGKINR